MTAAAPLSTSGAGVLGRGSTPISGGSSPSSVSGAAANGGCTAQGASAAVPGSVVPAPAGAHSFSHSARIARLGHPGRKYFADVRPSFVAAGDTVFEEGPRLVVP